MGPCRRSLVPAPPATTEAVPRREFLAAGSLAALAVGVLGSAGCGERQETTRGLSVAEARRRVVEYLRVKLPWLNHGEGTLERFAEEYVRWYPPGTKPTAGPNLVARYLLSTDFFPGGADESRPLEFVEFYDPYVSPCYNPLVEG